MEQGQLNWVANFIWGIADDVLRDLYVRGKYRDVSYSVEKKAAAKIQLPDSDAEIEPVPTTGGGHARQVSIIILLSRRTSTSCATFWQLRRRARSTVLIAISRTGFKRKD